MSNRLRGLLLMISSGVPSQNRFDKNDGSISGCVFLASFTAFSCCATFVSSFRNRYNTFSMTSHGNAYLVVLCMLAIVACLLVKCINARSSSGFNRIRPYVNDKTVWIKMKFLYLYATGAVFSQVISWIYRYKCSPSGIISGNYIAVRVVLIFYFVIQTFFIRIMCHFVMANSRIIYYALGLILVTNVAVWTHYTVTGFYCTENYMKLVNFTLCSNETTIAKVFWSSKVIVSPMILEYALLASIFIFEMWPKNVEIQQTIGYRSLSLTDSYSTINEEGSELHPLLGQRNNVIVALTKRLFVCCRRNACVITGVICVLLTLAFNLVDIFFEKGVYTLHLIIVFVISNSYMIVIVAIAFIVLYRDCEPVTNDVRRSSISNCLLVLSLIGFTFFMTLSLFANIFREDDVSVSIQVFAIWHEVTVILFSYLHTSFILQMRYCSSYKKAESSNSLSLDKLCLTLAVMHFMYWIKSSFISSSFRWHKGYEATYYGRETYDILFHIFFPFGVFFHFKTFVTFYGYYRQYKS